MNEGKKVVLFFTFLATVGSMWAGQTSESNTGTVLALLFGAGFLYLLLFWDNE